MQLDAIPPQQPQPVPDPNGKPGPHSPLPDPIPTGPKKELNIHSQAPLTMVRSEMFPGMRAFKPPRKSSILAGAGYIVSHRQNPEPRGSLE